LICIGGLGLLVVSDFVTDKNYPALDRAKGDGLMIAGATLYGFSMFQRSEFFDGHDLSQRNGRILRQEETSLRSCWATRDVGIHYQWHPGLWDGVAGHEASAVEWRNK